MRNAIRLFAPNRSVPPHAGLLHNLSIVLFLLLSMGVGLGTATVQAQTRAYVANFGSNTVSVIDIATNTVVATIPVGVEPAGVAITPDGTRAYVTNFVGTVSVIDAATNTVVVTIPVGQVPIGIAITPDGTRAYVTNENSNKV
jgi:YVTN family beta-propeller protein